MSTPSTKERLLDSAEAAFAEHGFAAASLRDITRRAGANLAAVHYHFGSKEALFDAVVARRIAPINNARLARLDALEALHAPGPVPLEELLQAFIVPAVEVFAGNPDAAVFLRLSGRMFTDPGEHWHGVRGLMTPVRDRFLAAFRRSLPDRSTPEVFWCMHFVFGTVSHALAAGRMLTFLSEGACDGQDLGQAVTRMLPFLAAGMRAPAPDAVTGGVQ